MTAQPDPVGLSFPGRLAAAREGLARAQKPGVGVPAYLRWVNRPLGRRLAALAFALGMSPNQVTLVSGLVSFVAIAAVAIVPASWVLSVGVSLALLLGYALDSADGQLARLLSSGNRAGEWLDHVVDAARMPALHLGLAWTLLRSGDDVVAAMAVGFALVSSVWFFSQILAEQLLARAGDNATDSAAPGAAAWVSVLKTLYDPGVLYLCVAFLAAPVWFGPAYGLLLVVAVAGMILSMRRKWTVLQAASKERA